MYRRSRVNVLSWTSLNFCVYALPSVLFTHVKITRPWKYTLMELSRVGSHGENSCSSTIWFPPTGADWHPQQRKWEHYGQLAGGWKTVYSNLTIEWFSWPWKRISVSVRYLFYQPMDEKIKTWTLRFPAKENPNMEKALFDWPIVLQYDVKAKYWLISRKFSGRKFFHLSVRLTN